MTRRLAVTAAVAAILGVTAPVAHGLGDVTASGRRLTCVGHVEYGGYCVSNPVPDAIGLVDNLTP